MSIHASLKANRTAMMFFVTLLVMCFALSSAQTEGKYQCKNPEFNPDTESPEPEYVDCATLFEKSCPTADDIANSTCPEADTSPCDDLPELCTYASQCEVSDENYENCQPSHFKLITGPPDHATFTFARVVKCRATNYLSATFTVDAGCDTATVPPAQLVYDPANEATEADLVTATHKCLPFDKTDPLDAVECPDPAKFSTDYAAQLQFCSGTTTSVAQTCTLTATIIGTEHSYTSAVTTCPTAELIQFVCPVYKITCADHYAVREEETDDPEEIDAAQCKTAKPTCPECTKNGIKLIKKFSIPAGFDVRCYSQDAEAWTLVTNTDDELYALCLRASGFTAATDPKKTEPEEPCADITTCPHYKCQDKEDLWSLDACYESIKCVLTEDFPVCKGTKTIEAKCYQGDEEWTPTDSSETNPCAAQTLYPNPILTQDCRPDAECPTFTWITDVIVTDEADTDFNEEETTSGDVVVTSATRKIVAKLTNVDLTAAKWKLAVFKRTAALDEQTQKVKFSYEEVAELTQKDLSADSTDFSISFETLPLDTYFVIRAFYDKYTLVQPNEDNDPDTGEQLDITDLAKFTLQAAEPEDPQDDPSEDDSVDDPSKQKPGYEKLGKIVNGCRVAFFGNCDNGSQCISSTDSTTKVTTYQCVCTQAFSGDVCDACTLTQADCHNGSELYTDEDSSGDDQGDDNGQEDQVSDFITQAQEHEKKDKQCKCVCQKANSGGNCGCKAIYIRIDFKSELSTASTAQNPTITDAEQKAAIKKWFAAFVNELAADVKLPANLFVEYQTDMAQPVTAPSDGSGQSSSRRNYIVLRLSACKSDEAQQSMVLSTLQQRIYALATSTEYTPSEVSSTWKAYTADSANLPSAQHAGGISKVSPAYDPACVSDCSPDVTDAAYDPESEGVTPDQGGDNGDSDSGLSGVAIFFIVLACIVAVIAIVVIVMYCFCNGSANKRRQFGSDANESGGSELDLT